MPNLERETEQLQLDLQRLTHQRNVLFNAVKAGLLFYADPPWNREKQSYWRSLTGRDEATTKVLCEVFNAAFEEVVAPLVADAEGRLVADAEGRLAAAATA